MIAVVASSLPPPARGRRLPCRTPVALSPLIVAAAYTVMPKSLGVKPQRHTPAGANRRLATLSDSRHITPAPDPAVKSP